MQDESIWVPTKKSDLLLEEALKKEQEVTEAIAQEALAEKLA